MNEEVRKILQMIQDGKITAEEAEKLISAIQNIGQQPEQSTKKAKWFRVRVYEGDMSKPKVNVNIPLGLAKTFLKIAGKLGGNIPENVRLKLEEKGISLDENISAEQLSMVVDSLTEQGPLKLVEVENDDEDAKQRVEVYIE